MTNNNFRDCFFLEQYARDKLERDQEQAWADIMTKHGVVKAWWDAGQPLPPALEKHLRAHKLVSSGAFHDGSLATVPASARLRIAKFLCSTVRFVTDPSNSSGNNPRVASAELIIKETVALDNLDGSGIAVGMQVFTSDKQRPVEGAHFFVESVPRTFFSRESTRHLLVLPMRWPLGHLDFSTKVKLQLGGGDDAALCRGTVHTIIEHSAWWLWNGIREQDLAARRLAR